MNTMLFCYSYDIHQRLFAHSPSFVVFQVVVEPSESLSKPRSTSPFVTLWTAVDSGYISKMIEMSEV